MLCSHPVKRTSNINGSNINRKTAQMLLPCNQCLNCRINKSRLWTNRIMLESLDYAQSSFVTLTYNEDFVPCTNQGLRTLFPRDVTLFFKKLRKNREEEYYRTYNKLAYCGLCQEWDDFKVIIPKIRYYYCGEYGYKDERPHYHIALFGMEQQEAYEECKKAWTFEGCPLGIVHVGELNTFSARYMAGYIAKKIGWDTQNDKMESLALRGRHKEYQRMSRGYALGSKAVERFARAAGDRKFNKVMRNGKEVYLGRTLKNLARKEQGIGNDYDDFANYTNELYDMVERGEDFREGVLTAMQGKRNRRQKLYQKFRKEGSL